MKIDKLLFYGVIPLSLSACAAGPSVRENPQAIPSIEAGKGRLVVYRPNALGYLFIPDVQLNGEIIGTGKALGVFFRDVTPGRYALTTSMTFRTVEFDILAGETKYISLNYGTIILGIYPELVDPATGEVEMANLSISK